MSNFSQTALPYLISSLMTLCLLFSFIALIMGTFTKKERQEAKYSIISTIAFLFSYTVLFIGWLLIFHPSISHNPNKHCMTSVLIVSFAADFTMYFSQLFYILRIRAIFTRLMHSKYLLFTVFLSISLHLILFVNIFFTFHLFAEQHPKFTDAQQNRCILRHSPNGIRPIINGCYHALILATFLFITSKILCSKHSSSTCNSRLTRTIIAGIFISVRIFFIPLYVFIDPRFVHWIRCISDILACFAVLSDYIPDTKHTSIPMETNKPNIDTHSNIPMSCRIPTDSTNITEDSKQPLIDAELENAFDDVINNGFTGKHIPPKLCKIMYRFWTKQYAKLPQSVRDKMDQKIHHKLKDSVQLPQIHMKRKHFGYLSHLNKLMINLLRVDVSLAFKLHETWRPLHSAIGLTSHHYDLVLRVMNEVLTEQFGDVYGADIKYVFQRICNTAQRLMFQYDEICDYGQQWLDEICKMNETDKQIIGKSLNDCISHERGQKIMWNYVERKAPQIYLFQQLLNTYKNMDTTINTRSTQKQKTLTEIQRICIEENSVCAIAIGEELRDRFVSVMQLIEHDASESALKEMDAILSLIYDEQINIIENSYWKTFSMFIL